MVMFRDFVQRKASGLKLTGEVRNVRDGTVHVVAEGDHMHLEKLLAKIQHGPLLAQVKNVSATWTQSTGEYKSFKITYGK